MIIHKCDICGKEMVRWVSVKTCVSGNAPWVNVGDDLIRGNRDMELCETCIKEIKQAIDQIRLTYEDVEL